MDPILIALLVTLAGLAGWASTHIRFGVTKVPVDNAPNSQITQFKEEPRVVATHDVLPKWKKIWDEQMRLSGEINYLSERRTMLQHEFWVKVQEDLGHKSSYRYNTQKNVIEQLEV